MDLPSFPDKGTLELREDDVTGEDATCQLEDAFGGRLGVSRGTCDIVRHGLRLVASASDVEL